MKVSIETGSYRREHGAHFRRFSGGHLRSDEGAEISDGAGELGFFAPHSWWPILVALAASVAAVGIALWLPWLIVAGVCFVLATAAGLVFEYYTGPEKH